MVCLPLWMINRRVLALVTSTSSFFYWMGGITLDHGSQVEASKITGNVTQARLTRGLKKFREKEVNTTTYEVVKEPEVLPNSEPVIATNTKKRPPKLDPEAAKVFAYWTPERIKNAVPLGPEEPIGEDVISPLITDFWTKGGVVQKAVGRIYFAFETAGDLMCSGTAVTDGTSGRSVIITAAHCVYDAGDDPTRARSEFSYNAIFIPNQAETTGYYTDWNCANDPFGCWALNFGVVDEEWTNKVWDFNRFYDYAFYVVADTGRHLGRPRRGALDGAVGTLPVSFSAPTTGIKTYAFGYPENYDPHLRYCDDYLAVDGGNWLLSNCELGGGASGGPWIQPMNVVKGSGPIIGVTSFGPDTAVYSPKLFGNSAECLFNIAKKFDFTSVVNRGVVVNSMTDCPKSSVIFREDFLGTSLDTKIWTVDTGKLDRTVLGNTPIITGGTARLTFDTYGFKGTEIFTKRLFSLGTKGLEIEAKIKLVTPLPSGLVTCFYTWVKNPSGSVDEIDMNILSKQLNMAAGKALVLETFDNSHHWSSSKTISDVGNWHTYTIRWLPGRTYWLVDGVVVEDSDKVQPNADSYVGLLFYAPDSSWPDAYDKNFKPVNHPSSNKRYFYDIDYVEVRQLM
jgi:hypothetical protein